MMKRKAKIERRRASGGAAFEREPFEGARSFGISLTRRLCFPAGRALPSARRSSRALAFARQIAARHAQQGGARTLEFLRSYFGGKYEVIEGQGLTGTRIYKKPGGTILESTYRLSLNFSLLLNLTRSVEAFNLRLMRNNLTLLQSFTGLMTLASKDASPVNLPSRSTSVVMGGNTSVVNRTSLMKRWSEIRSLLKLLSAHTHAQSTAYGATVIVPRSTELARRDSFTRREVKERVRAIGSSARVLNLLAVQGRARAGSGGVRTLHPAATQAHHFNFALFPQSFNQSFRQTYLYVQSYFGGKYEVVEGWGSTGAGMQSNPGERIQDRPQESTYKLSLDFRLLLNLTRSVETLNLRLMRNSLSQLQHFTELTKFPGKDASLIRLPGRHIQLTRLPSERALLVKPLSTRTHAQSTASAAPIPLRRSTVFDRRDSLARGYSARVSSLPAARAASLFINRLNAQAVRITNSSAEAQRDSLTVLRSTATQVSYINIALSRQSLVSAPRREIVSHNFAQTYLQHHFRRGGNLHTALAFAAQSSVSGRVLIRQQNFLRSLSYNSLAHEAAPLAHDFKQTPASLFISETYAMGLTGAPTEPPALSGTMSLTLPFRQSLLSLFARRTLQREILQRRAHLRQGGFADIWNITTRNSLTLTPIAVRPLARFTIARELMPAAVGPSFSRTAVHEKLAREKLAREGLMLEAYALETRTPEKLMLKVRPLSFAAQFVSGGMKKMVIVNTRAWLAGPRMVSAHTATTINAGAIVNVRPQHSAAAKRAPVPFTLNLARGAVPAGSAGPMPALLLGKVDTLRLTPPAYVYAQPVRSTLEAQRVITQVDHKEVTRIVQREVQSARASDSDVERFSHADYAQIADQVYSTLVRRLIVEKERLGLC